MADVTGKIYECFTEYLLRRVGWARGPGSDEPREFLYEQAVAARCHTAKAICPHADECSSFSKERGLRYGPWYKPDFFLTDGAIPFGCIHVAHWSSPKQSCYKFWRTIEDHLQYKTLYGHGFVSISFLFEALDPGEPPELLQDGSELKELHGWSPANGTMQATSYDASILFPLQFGLLHAYVNALPSPMPKLSAARRRDLYHETWESLYQTNPVAKQQVDGCADLLRKALELGPHPRYTSASVQQLQAVCFRGRQLAADARTTCSRYRKGIQHAFIIRELIGEYWGDRVDPDAALWRILSTSPRFQPRRFASLLGLSDEATDPHLEDWCSLLSALPVKMVHRNPIPLLDTTSGVGGMVSWDPDTRTFIQSLQSLGESDLATFRGHIDALFEQYRGAYGMGSVVRDLAHPERVHAKVEFVRSRFLGLELGAFTEALVPEMLSPFNTPSHQEVVPDTHNWPLDVLLVMFDLGSYQHITATLPLAFKRATGEELRPYAYVNQLGQLVSHLIAGVPVGQFFSRKCQLGEEAFYETIWPLFAECLWQAIQETEPLSFEKTCEDYRKKKAMRIISSPDLEPIKFLFQRALPDLESGPTLRGCFNQLSTARGWSRAALTTATSGLDPKSGAIIQTQAVFGGKHIADKTKELSARIRSVHLSLADDGTFVPEPAPGVHYLVVDGDWPIESKINLYEAGFSGIFEIAELDGLTDALAKLDPLPEEEP
jgi:hypothetical protein